MDSKRNTAIVSSLAIVALAMLFATGPLVADHTFAHSYHHHYNHHHSSHHHYHHYHRH